MDKQIIALLIPILALAIPVAAVILGGLHRIAKTRLEETRLRVQGEGGPAGEELQAMRHELEAMRSELSELSERVDFTERLLARPPASPPERPG